MKNIETILKIIGIGFLAFLAYLAFAAWRNQADATTAVKAGLLDGISWPGLIWKILVGQATPTAQTILPNSLAAIQKPLPLIAGDVQTAWTSASYGAVTPFMAGGIA